jgi:hypothetical protein
VGRAEGHAVGWRAARRAEGAGTEARHCEQRDNQLDGPNAPGRVASEERAATSVRRAGGEATLRALVFTEAVLSAKDRVPEVSLRRRRVLLVAARSSPCGAARGKRDAGDNHVMTLVHTRAKVAMGLRDRGAARAVRLTCSL